MMYLLHVSASKCHHKEGQIQMNTDVANLTDCTVFVFFFIKPPRLWCLSETKTCMRHTMNGKQLLIIYWIRNFLAWLLYIQVPSVYLQSLHLNSGISISNTLIATSCHFPSNLSFAKHPTVGYYVVLAIYNVVKQTVSKTATRERMYRTLHKAKCLLLHSRNKVSSKVVLAVQGGNTLACTWSSDPEAVKHCRQMPNFLKVKLTKFNCPGDFLKFCPSRRN